MMNNRVAPTRQDHVPGVSWNVSDSTDTEPAVQEGEHLTDDDHLGPAAQQPSRQARDTLAAFGSWLMGQRPRKMDAQDVVEGRRVTAFAKQLMPLLKEASTSQSTVTTMKVLVFVGLNTLLVAMLFIYPLFNTHQYLHGGHQVVDGSAHYGISQSLSYGHVKLKTDDSWVEQVPDDNAEQLEAYDMLVSLPFDAAGDPGWNLQDILDIPRTFDTELQYTSTSDGRMVQDYRRCAADCLDDSGQPADMKAERGVNATSSIKLYGEWGDFYIRRELLLSVLDHNYFQQYMNSSMSSAIRSSRGNFGFPSDSEAADNPLTATMPTEIGYLCNLGRPRKLLDMIQINSKSCYLKIVSAPGDRYEVYLRTAKDMEVEYAIKERDVVNTTSGCQTYALDITVQAPDCSRPQLTGVDPSCELSCALILFKGVNARRVPIKVVDSSTGNTWPSSLHINDKYLVLDQGPASRGLPDLEVTGGSIAVNISGARVGSLVIQNTAGVVTLDHARVDRVFANSTTDNVVIEDDRDTELLYRTAGNLLCAAAPLVEAIPDAFLGCVRTNNKPYEWYDSTPDGVIDHEEFTAGLAKLGISLGPDSLNLDEEQQTVLLDTVFKDGPGASDAVALSTFDDNLQEVRNLDFMSETWGLLDPECYNGRFLKLRPQYSATSPDNAAQIAAAAVELDGNGTVVDTRMPGYLKSASHTSLNPCPADWGTGIQGSTNFTYFRWANASLGYKWGKALPSWCLDELWPSGGISGKYPEDKLMYGALAGQPILPGCEPASCKPVYKVVTTAGSIHAQVLPFEFDVINATGNYQTMIANCEDSDGQSRCFYKGWADDADATVHAYDLPGWQQLMDPCYADSMECSDAVQAVTVTGHGAPMHQKWFWSSRKVYLQLEPAWYLVMSGTLLQPDINQVQLRLSPGYCTATLGAVEHIDWRHSHRFDGTVNQRTSATGVSNVASGRNDVAPSNRGPRDALSAQRGLRGDRSQQIYQRLEASINGTAPDRSGWFLKQSIRQDYMNESLALSPTTASGELDTDPGHVDAAGKLQGAGPSYRHKRVCIPGRNCLYEYMIHRDTCQVPLTAGIDPATGKPVLSTCTFPDGTLAWRDPILRDSGPTFNDSYYAGQFPWPDGQYGLEQLHNLKGDELLQQAMLADYNTHEWDNVTQQDYSKWSLQTAESGDVQLTDATDAWMQATPLYCAVILSLVIAAMCSLLVVAMLVYMGMDMLKKINIELQARAKIELAVLEERKAAMFAEVLEAKRLMVKEACTLAAQRAAAARNDSLKQQDNATVDLARLASDTRCTAADINPGGHAAEKVGDDVFLTEAEKLEVLRVWEDKGFFSTDFRSWDKSVLVQTWLEEVRLRHLPAHNPTLLPENAPPDTSRFAALRNRMTTKRRVDIVLKDAGPFGATQNKTLDAAALAANPVKLHKVESKLHYEAKMNKLQKQYSRRGSREAQALLSKNTSGADAAVAADGNVKSQKGGQSLVPPAWQLRLQQLIDVNKERLKRLLQRMVQLCMYNLPSPFKVIDDAVVDLFQNMWVDSLSTFLQVKCLFDHDMISNEEILLGQCELARSQLGPSTVAKANKPVAAKDRNQSSSAGSSSGQAEEGSEATSKPVFIELDGEGDVVACTAVDGKVEMYRVKYVRMTLKSTMVQVAAGDSDSEADSDDDHGEDSNYASDMHKESSIDSDGTSNAIKQAGFGGWSKHVKDMGKTFAKITAVAGGFMMDGEEDQEEGDKKLVKKRRVWQVVIEEGPGVVTSSKYRPELEPLVPCSIKQGIVPRASAAGTNSSLLKGRSISLPCPTRKELQLLSQNELHTAGRVRHYMVATKGGSKIITIDTLPTSAERSMLLGGRHMAPRVQFSAPLSSFTPDYEKFCMENDLQAKDVLASTAVLADNNITFKKKVMAKIKGLKQKAANVDSPEELAGLAEDSCIFPSQMAHAVESPNCDGSEDGGKSAAGQAAHRQSDDNQTLRLTGPDPQPRSAHHRSTMSGDSDDDEDDEQAALLLAQGSTAAVGCSTGGAARLSGVGRTSVRGRSTAGVLPSTAAEAKAAAKADKKKPSWKLMQLLEASQEPLAVFLRETYEITGNFVADEVDVDIMQRQYRRWLRSRQQGTSAPGAAASIAGLALPQASLHSSAAGQSAEAATLTASGAVVAGTSIGAFDKVTGGQVAAFGFKYQQAPEHTMFGVLVNPQDYDDDPRDANRLVYLAAELASVILHTIFIWLFPIPFFAIVFGFQGYFNVTTSIQPMLTIDSFRFNPLAFMKLQINPLLQALVVISIIWVCFCYVKLLCHYLLMKYEDKPWRAVLKTLFWGYLTIMVAVLVAYVFEVFCWVILGAVINPNKFLPYSVAAITLVAHAKATWQRLITKFNGYRDALSQSVMGAFQDKIGAAEDATAQTEELLQQKLAEAADTANEGLRARASLTGLAEEASSAAAGMLGVAAGAVGIGLLGAVAGPALAGRSAPARRVWPGLRGSNTDNMDGQDDDDDNGETGGATDGYASHTGRVSFAAKQRMERQSDAGQASRQLSRSGSAAKSRTGSSGGAGGAVRGTTGGISGKAAGGSSRAKSGDFECYDMFKMFAADDDTLDYTEFCALLEHLDIRLLEEKRRKLFARLDKSGDNSIGYTEFQEGFKLLKQQIVDRHMAKKGITMGRLICLLIYAVIILLLIFVFIFLGVAAFTGANTMGAIVNSCMTAGAGIAMNLGGENGEGEEEEEDVDLSDA